jgi:23S rRNA G2445 N2-methylase RlmL
MIQHLAKPQRFLVRPAPGWSAVTLTEVQNILQSPVQRYKFSPLVVPEDGQVVVSECDYRQGLEILSRVTTAHDVDWVLHSGRISRRGDWPVFFERSGVAKLWQSPERVYIKFTASVSHPILGNEREIKELARGLIPLGPEAMLEGVDGQGPGLRQTIHLESTKNRQRLLVSLGGEPVYKRGYKVPGLPAVAPLPEHHAAACFRWAISQFENRSAAHEWVIVNPFAGSGTTAIEALIQIMNIAPGVIRSSFACESFEFHPTATMASIRHRLGLQVSAAESAPAVVLGDINDTAVKNLPAQFDNFCQLVRRDIPVVVMANDFLSNPQALFAGVDPRRTVFLPLNPPFGQRLAKASGSLVIYERLSKILSEFARTRPVCGYVLCPDEETWGVIVRGLRSLEIKTQHFSHGGVDMRVVAFCGSSAFSVK